MTVLIFIAMLLSGRFTFGQINVEPRTVTLKVGDQTNLLCYYGRAINYCRIEIPNEKVLNLSPDWDKTAGYKYYGDGFSTGQCGVTISHAKLSNNGKVRCSLGFEGEELSGTIDLIIAVRPQQPTIELITKSDSEGYFNESGKFQARCIIRDARPAANIIWMLDNIPAEKRLTQLEVFASTSDALLSTTVQEIQWHLGPEDNGEKLICISHHLTDSAYLKPQEAKFLLLVRYAPIRQEELLLHALYLDKNAFVNLTIRANPAPVIELIVDGNVISEGLQNGRFSLYEAQYLGNEYYNVIIKIAELTLEDTIKVFNIRASNIMGSTDYQIRINPTTSSPTVVVGIGIIVGSIIVIISIIAIFSLIIFAQITDKWWFRGE